jgi:hypothetical protein
MSNRFWAVMLAVCGARAQSVAPEVLLQARIKAHTTHELEGVPNYTCLETVSRFRADTRSRNRYDRVMAPLDTVRMEIVYSGGKEWYGSPGERNLETQNPAAFVGGGMIGNGAFAGILHNVMSAATLTWHGEEVKDGRRAARFDFALPRRLNALLVTLPEGQGQVGQEGSIWADLVSLDMIAVEARVTEIPPFLPLSDSETYVKYARMRIGGLDVLMAQQAESHMRTPNGVESFNRMEFTHCRAYSAQSEIRFEAPSGDEATTPAPARTAPEPAHGIPAFLQVRLELTTPVSTNDTVGTLIEARVMDDVMNKRSIAIPKGSTVHGRIRRMEPYRGRDATIVALEFSELELRGLPVPFYANLLSLEKNPRIRAELSERVVVPGGQTQQQKVTLPELPGVASFFVDGSSFSLPKGFQTVWRTRGVINGVDRKR